MESLKYAAMIAGYIIPIITMITLICKPVRNSIFKAINKLYKEDKQDDQLNEISHAIQEIKEELANQKKMDAKQQEALRCTLRNTITHLYYKYKLIGKIPALERENATFLYEAYDLLEGNSYIQQCYKEIMEFQVES